MPEILLENITKTYVSDFRRRKKTAVDGVSLSIDKGDSFGIIGRNGAGKSSIIKMVLGFTTPDSGRIMISGKSPSDPGSRRRLGYLPENPFFYHNLTPMELLMFSCSASGVDRREALTRIDTLLHATGIYDERNHKLGTFSKGMIQRAGICFALVHDPDVIIFDEPMSGLDPCGRKMVIDLVTELKQSRKTIMFCSHILNDVERICDRVGIMDKGKLKKVFTRDQIREKSSGSENLEEVFLHTINRAR